MSIINRQLNLILFLLFIFLFFIGSLLFKDFGISIDETSTRFHGLVSLNYIKIIMNNFFNLNLNIDSNIPKLEDYEFKDYGVLFELLSLSFENIFSVKGYQNIYEFKHLITHSFFLVSVIFLIKIIYKYFDNIYLAFCGGICFYTTPRIFAHSFFNNKDIVFMSFFVIAIYFTLNFFKKKSMKNLVLSCLSIALLTSTRVIGVYFFFIFLIFLLIEILENRKFKSSYYDVIKILFFYFLFLYLTWPFLWSNPIENFVYAIKSMANYPWDGYVFYLGNFHSSFYLPWHYLIIWVIASNPLLIIITFIFSIFYFLRRFFNRLIKIDNSKKTFFLWNNNREFFSYFNIAIVLFPLIAIIVKNSTIYTGWRHVYFIYPSLILLSINLIHLFGKIFSKLKFAKILIPFLIFIILLNINALIKYHPFQNVFFNTVFKKEANKLFEIDYWGVSNVESLKRIIALKQNKFKICNLGLMNLNQSKNMLDSKDVNKILLYGQNFNECEFVISNNIFISNPKFTKKYQLPPQFKKIDTISRDNIVINEIYKKK